MANEGEQIGITLATTGVGLLVDVAVRATLQPDMVRASDPRMVIAIGAVGILLLVWGVACAVADRRRSLEA